VHPGDLAGEFSDLEMTWLLYCTVAATASVTLVIHHTLVIYLLTDSVAE